VRTLRHRRGWRQIDLCERARRPRSALVELEAGRIGRLKIDVMRDFVEALGASVRVDIAGGASDPRLLIDAGHAFVQEHWKRRLEAWGWLVRAEVSFNRYGDRGRIDLLAYHAASHVLLVIEVKTVLWDLQALLGGLDVKVRVAPFVARELGCRPATVMPILIVAASTTARRRIEEHSALFAPFGLRGRELCSWLRRPSARRGGGLLLTKVPDVATGDLRRAGRRRVRARRARPS